MKIFVSYVQNANLGFRNKIIELEDTPLSEDLFQKIKEEVFPYVVINFIILEKKKKKLKNE